MEAIDTDVQSDSNSVIVTNSQDGTSERVSICECSFIFSV